MEWKTISIVDLLLDRDRSKTLGEKFEVEGIPTLVILSSSGNAITSDGVEEFYASSEQAFPRWVEGKRLFWSREAKEGEFTWQGISCDECFLSPIVGSRYGCTKGDKTMDLCQSCAEKKKDEHAFEYLTPKKSYTLQQIFQSVPHLLEANAEKTVPVQTLMDDQVKAIGIYFSAHWCPPCRGFTPKLAELYREAQKESLPFRIVFVSSDRDEEAFKEYHATMPWLAVPLKNGNVLKQYFQCRGQYYHLASFHSCFFEFSS